VEYEKKKSVLEMENQLVKHESKQKSFYLVFLSVISFFLLITVYFIIRLQKTKAVAANLEKKRIEEELEFKNRELAANVMTMLKKNEVLTTLSEKLLEAESKAVKNETKETINHISQELQKTQDTELWEEFDKRFKQVNNKFYSKLFKIAPDITPKEQRICALLKMNMSTKDIADLMTIEPKTIDNTRYKIRKKLRLDGKTNLVNYLSRI